jgi:hypothetical protein
VSKRSQWSPCELSHPEGGREMQIVWRDAGSVVGSWGHG